MEEALPVHSACGHQKMQVQENGLKKRAKAMDSLIFLKERENCCQEA